MPLTGWATSARESGRWLTAGVDSRLWAARPLPAIDSLLAAIALKHARVLVKRKLRDFAGPPVQMFNPWTVPS